MRHDFFPTGRAGPAKEKRILKLPGRTTKKARSKKSKMKNIARQSEAINLLLIIIITISECVSQSASSGVFHN